MTSWLPITGCQGDGLADHCCRGSPLRTHIPVRENDVDKQGQGEVVQEAVRGLRGQQAQADCGSDQCQL